MFPSNHFMARQIQGGALKKLDRSQLPGWSNLNPVLMKALETNDVKEKMSAQGAVPGGNSPAEFTKMIASEHEKWAKVVKDSGAKIE